MATNNHTFLCRRMRELREKNGLTMEDMAKRLNKANKSSISRVESGNTSYSALIESAKEYCNTFKMDPNQTEQFLRGDRIVIPDTSALLHNPQLIDELSREYSRVVIPKIVIDELDHIKNHRNTALSRRAWEIIRSIGTVPNTLQRDYRGDQHERNNDCRIIHIAREVSEEFGCEVDIITNDADYSAYLKGEQTIRPLYLRGYMATKQEIVSMTRIQEIDSCFASCYDGMQPPTEQEANAYFDNGNTLIISTVRNRAQSLEERTAKIRWLISHGADVNKRDCSRRYFPPLSHAVQMGDYPMFLFLLKECHADPNVASRNPHDAGKVRQKNEGNTPLMIAAWEGKKSFVRTLCQDPRTSINQQDANGFTALIKACANRHLPCRDILLAYGADTKIVDINGKTCEDHLNDALEFGPMRNRWRRP